MARSSKRERNQVVGLFGIGLDGADGHRRVTKGEDFILVGGSSETHERMQEVAIKFEEVFEKRGKRIEEVEVVEIADLLHEAAQD